jgi:hypothetical protein
MPLPAMEDAEVTAVRLLLVACAVFAPAPPARAVIIGNFKSIDDLLDSASAVVVVRIEKNIDGNEGPDLGTTQACQVLSVLKGGIKKGTTLDLRLVNTSERPGPVWTVGSHHLLFLVRVDGGAKWAYRSLGIQGSNLPVSPLTTEKTVKGLAAKDAVKALIREYAEYREKQMRKEKAFLDKILGGK